MNNIQRVEYEKKSKTFTSKIAFSIMKFTRIKIAFINLLYRFYLLKLKSKSILKSLYTIIAIKLNILNVIIFNRIRKLLEYIL